MGIALRLKGGINMIVHRIITNAGWIARCLLVAALLVVATGCERPGFHVTSVGVGVQGNWYATPVPPPDPYRVRVTIRFNRAVDETTVSAPETVRIDLKGMSDGRTVYSIDGSFQFDTDHRKALFTSDQTLSDLIHPGAGENIQYTIVVLDEVTDHNGEALDGDVDGNPGGNFGKVIEVVG